MKVNRLESHLLKLYNIGSVNARQSVLLLGPPGVGKSLSCKNSAEKIAKSLEKIFIDYNDDLAPKIMAEPDRYFVFVDLRSEKDRKLTECEPKEAKAFLASG